MASDIDSVTTLLASGFGDPDPDFPTWLFDSVKTAIRKRLASSHDRTDLSTPRARDFWQRCLERLGKHATPEGYPRYGYLLEADGDTVGVLLLIFKTSTTDGKPNIACNVSSWYVRPAFRAYGAMLVSRALKNREVTYYNITPSPVTWPILEAQGYKQYCAGVLLSVPLLSRRLAICHVEQIRPDLMPGNDLSRDEIDLLVAHAHYGCVSLICSSEGKRSPFVFSIRRKYGAIRLAYLIFSRSQEDFARFARPLGCALARMGIFVVAVDANGPVAGLVGPYIMNVPKYARGDNQPRLGDIAHSERAMFGV